MAAKTIQAIRDSLERGVAAADLAPQQAAVLCYVLQCWMSGFIPTYRGICDEFGYKSPNAALTHLRALQRKGYVEELEEKSSLMLSDKAIELAIREV